MKFPSTVKLKDCTIWKFPSSVKLKDCIIWKFLYRVKLKDCTIWKFPSGVKLKDYTTRKFLCKKKLRIAPQGSFHVPFFLLSGAHWKVHLLMRPIGKLKWRLLFNRAIEVNNLGANIYLRKIRVKTNKSWKKHQTCKGHPFFFSLLYNKWFLEPGNYFKKW